MSGLSSFFAKPDPPLPDADLTGRVCLVTGATAGHGKACARALATLGAEVVLLGRNPAKCERVQAEIRALTGKRPSILLCDLSSRHAIDRAAAEWLAQGRPLNLLINNAGLVSRHRQESVDGLELTFAVNYLAYFQLSLRLLPRMLASASARIVQVASDAHRMASLPLHDLQGVHGYDFMTAYARSKLAIVYFNRALALKLIGTGVTTNAVDPGPVAWRSPTTTPAWWRRWPPGSSSALSRRLPGPPAPPSTWPPRPRWRAPAAPTGVSCRPSSPRWPRRNGSWPSGCGRSAPA